MLNSNTFPIGGFMESLTDDIINNIIIKHSPALQLLHSPLQSLKNSEKDQVITTLNKDLKEKIRSIHQIQKQGKNYQQLEQKYTSLRIECTKWKQSYHNLQQKNKSLQNQLISTNKQLNEIKECLKTQIYKEQDQKQQYKNKIKILYQQIQCRMKQYQFKEQQLIMNKKIQEIQQQIMNKRQKNIKKQYYLLLILKAKKINFIKKRKIKINKQKRKKILYSYFNILNYNAIFMKQNKSVCTKYKVNKFRQFWEALLYNYSFSNHEKRAKTRGILLSKTIKTFVKKFRSIKQQKQNKQRAIKFNKSTKMINCFNYLADKIRQKHDEQAIQKARQYYESSILWKYFKLWWIVNDQIDHKIAELKINRIDNYRKKFLKTLVYKFQQIYQLKINRLTLSIYLKKYRYIMNFHKFRKIISTKILYYEIRQNRIQTIRKNIYLSYWIKTVKQQQIKRKIMQYKKKLIQQQRRGKNIQHIIDTNVHQNQQKFKFTLFIRKLYNKKIKLILLYKSKCSFIEKKILQNNNKTFFINLRIKYCKHLRIRQKLHYFRAQLSIKCINQHLKRLFMKKCINNHRKSSKLKLYIRKKKKNLLYKIFKSWHIENLQQKSYFLQQKVNQYGPQIDYIENRQETACKQRQLLVLDLKDKEQKLQIYEKKLSEYEFLLDNKQYKYNKLKEIYQEALEAKQIEGLFLTETKPQRDYDSYNSIPIVDKTIKNYQYLKSSEPFPGKIETGIFRNF